MYLFRWGHVFLVYIMVALAYVNNYYVIEGTFNYFLKFSVCVAFVFLVVDLVFRYAFKNNILRNVEKNYDSFDEKRRINIQTLFLKIFTHDKEIIQYLNTSEKKAVKKVLLNILDEYKLLLPPNIQKAIFDILEELK